MASEELTSSPAPSSSSFSEYGQDDVPIAVHDVVTDLVKSAAIGDYETAKAESNAGGSNPDDISKILHFGTMGLIPSCAADSSKSGNGFLAPIESHDHGYSNSPTDSGDRSSHGLPEELLKLYRIANDLETPQSSKKASKTFTGNFRGRKPTTHFGPVSNKCLEPFKKGWRRELVHRQPATNEGHSKTSDVYYHPPTGRKLRSYRDIAEYLKQKGETELTLDCFSFRKVAIHRPPEEIVRGAGDKYTAFFKPKKPTLGPKFDLQHTPQLYKRHANPERAHSEPIKRRKVFNYTNTPKMAVTPMREKVEMVPCSIHCPGITGAMIPTLQCNECLRMYHPECVGLTECVSPFSCNECIMEHRSAENHKRMKENTYEPIKRLKFGADQPEISIEVTSSYTDQDKEDSTPAVTRPAFHALPRLNDTKSVNSVAGSNRPPPPLKAAPQQRSVIKPIKIIGTWTPPSGLPPKTIPLPKLSPAPIRMAKINTLLFMNKNNSGVSQPLPPLSVGPRSQGPVVVTTVTTNQFPSAQTPTVTVSENDVQQPSTSNEVVEISPELPPLPQTGLVTMVNGKGIVSKPPGTTVGTMKFVLRTNVGTVTEVIVPQVAVANCTEKPQPKYIIVNEKRQPSALMLQFGANMVQLPILNPTTCQNATSGANVPTKVAVPTNLLKANVKSGEKEHEEVAKPVEEEKAKDDNETNPLNTETLIDLSKDDDCDAKPETGATEQNDLPEKALAKKSIKASLASVRRLFTGAKCFLKVFEYLRQDDLSRASSVCKSWLWATSQPQLWKCIKLDGICVHNWDKLAMKIKKYSSNRLDMRQMVTFEDRNRTWHGFVAILQDLDSIEHVDFGHVPASILHTVTSNLTHLKILTAEWITEFSTNICRIDVGVFGRLKNLKKLRLRGVAGLQLPTFTLSRGFASLGDLQNLVHLSLTSLRDIPASEFEFVKQLTKLKRLEIGDCKTWTAETYDYLSHLADLEILRVETGNADAHYALCEVAPKLEKLYHLELYCYEVNESLMSALRKFSQLQFLSIWPSTDQAVDVTNTLILKGLQKLKPKMLVWGLLTAQEEEIKSAVDSDSEIIVISSTYEKRKNNRTVKNERVPFLLDGKEILTFDEAESKVQILLPDTLSIFLHSAHSDDAFQLSHIGGDCKMIG